MIPSHSVFSQINLFTEPGLREEILKHGELQAFERNDVLVREGQFVKTLPIVLSGGLRVFQTKEEREILLYYVEPAQTCMMSLSACFFNDKSPSQAVAIEPTEVLAVPTRFVSQWQTAYPSWNSFVIRTFRHRYDELLNTFESVAFDHIDKRVMEYLQRRVSREGNRKIEISHLELANELGTTRVVISRIVKQFEMDKKVLLHRGSIEIL